MLKTQLKDNFSQVRESSRHSKHQLVLEQGGMGVTRKATRSVNSMTILLVNYFAGVKIGKLLLRGLYELLRSLK